MKFDRKDLDFPLAHFLQRKNSSGFADWQKLFDDTVIFTAVLNHLPDRFSSRFPEDLLSSRSAIRSSVKLKSDFFQRYYDNLKI